MNKNSTTTEKVDDKEIELLKTVAQTWLAQSGNPKPSNDEFHTRKARHVHRPTRFKLEAMEMAAKGRDDAVADASERSWDFSMSLLDSYEIVTLSKKLEANIALEKPVQLNPPGYSGQRGKQNRERKNRLIRSLFRRSGSTSSSKS